jgi:hypothetical protein
MIRHIIHNYKDKTHKYLRPKCKQQINNLYVCTKYTLRVTSFINTFLTLLFIYESDLSLSTMQFVFTFELNFNVIYFFFQFYALLTVYIL